MTTAHTDNGRKKAVKFKDLEFFEAFYLEGKYGIKMTEELAAVYSLPNGWFDAFFSEPEQIVIPVDADVRFTEVIPE